MPKAIPQPTTTELPPPGDERREVLKEREDTLQEAAETRAAQLEIETIAPRAFMVENELAQEFDELEVPGALPEYHYCWVNTGRAGQFVQRKLYQGWEVVQGISPEAEGLKGVDTTRRLGDVLLMRIHKDRKRLLDQREDYKRRMQELAVGGSLEELEDKYRSLGVKAGVISNPNDPMLRRMANSAQARQTGQRRIDGWLREGRMPGMTT